MGMKKHSVSNVVIETPCGRCRRTAPILYDSTLEPNLKICFNCKELEEKGSINGTFKTSASK